MRTRIIGQQFIRLAQVDSTNKYAADLLSLNKAAHGTVILADEQTAGRGQRGRVWRSAPGLDIATSVVLLPDGLKAPDQFLLAKVAALAVHDVVAEAMRITVGKPDRVRIKWPNDILIDRRKVAGILIKNEVVGGLVMNTVIGIGINVNSSELEAEFNATSLRMETGVEQDRLGLLEQICVRLEHWWELSTSRPAALDDRYRELLWSKGRFTELELDGAPITARPVDVGPDGRLLVELETGEVAAFGLERLRFAPR